MMIGKLAWAGVAVATLMSSVPANAGGILGVGTVGSCSFAGKAKIKPGLVLGGTVTPVVTKVSGKLSGCTGGTGDGSGVVSGKVKGVITSTGTNDCLALATVGLAGFDLNVKWKSTSAKLLASTIHVAATPPGSIVLGAAVTITMAGTADAAGSFGGNAFTASAITDETVVAFTTACGAKGLKAFNFSGVNGPSTFGL